MIYHGATRFVGTHYHDELLLNEKQQQLFGKEYPHQLYPEYYLLKVNQFDDVARDSLDEWIYWAHFLVGGGRPVACDA